MLTAAADLQKYAYCGENRAAQPSITSDLLTCEINQTLFDIQISAGVHLHVSWNN